MRRAGDVAAGGGVGAVRHRVSVVADAKFKIKLSKTELIKL